MAFGDGVVKRIRWFRVAPSAELFPYWNVFSSANWDNEHPLLETPLGEVAGATRPWSNGATPAGLTGTGLQCGSEEEWEDGPTDPERELPLTPEGIPICCTTPPTITTDCCPTLPINETAYVKFDVFISTTSWPVVYNAGLDGWVGTVNLADEIPGASTMDVFIRCRFTGGFWRWIMDITGCQTTLNIVGGTLCVANSIAAFPTPLPGGCTGGAPIVGLQLIFRNNP